MLRCLRVGYLLLLFVVIEGSLKDIILVDEVVLVLLTGNLLSHVQ